jgi:predicted trehalose synthase
MTNHQQTAALALAKCAAYDPWFPKASLATVEAWAEAIAEYNLDTEDVLAGVKLAYRDNGSGFKPLPKDIVQAARNIRRDRTERETTTQREEREAAIDAKAAGRIRNITDYTNRFTLKEKNA